jgi:hypothetical protein
VNVFADWPPTARALVERACVAYGGSERWARTRLSFVPAVLSGALPALKGAGRTFALPSRIHLEPGSGQAVFDDFPRPGERGLYQAGAVSIIGRGGREESRDLVRRASFRGWHKLARWRPLDALYFFGYALSHYHSVPFTLGEAHFLRQDRWRDLDALALELPPALHTHSRRQTFYFDEDGLIVRHDYVAEIVGGWARGAHFWRHYTRVEGLPLALTRHVVARIGRFPLPFVALHAELAEPRVSVG